MNHDITVIDETAAQQKLREVEDAVSALAQAENSVEKGWANFAFLLTEVNEKEYWRQGGHTSFNQYLKSLRDKYNLGRTQIYGYISVVKELKPYVTAPQLNEMGITKAKEIQRSVKQSGFPPSEQVLTEAVKREVSVESVRKMLFEENNPQSEQPETEKGTWFDFDGFYVTKDERLVINQAFDAAYRTDPIVSETLPQWARRKEAILRLSMEYLSTHSAAVEQGIA